MDDPAPSQPLTPGTRTAVPHSAPLQLLLLEDSAEDAEMLTRELRQGGFDLTVNRLETAAELRAALDAGTGDLVLSDYNMPGFSALDALEIWRASRCDVPFIIVSGMISEESAVSALRAGAHDFVVKSKLARLVPAIQRELREAEGRRKRREAEEALRVSELQLRQAQKMESLGRLAGGIAHDFNNLMTVILGYSDLLLAELPSSHSGYDLAREIFSAGERAALLTRRLLAFSRKQVLAPTVLDLNLLLREAEGLLRRLIGEDIELVTDLDPGLGRVRADPGQIEQIVINLAVNARDAMPSGGRLLFKTRNCELHGWTSQSTGRDCHGPHVLLSVCDTGCGMDAATRERIFDPFFTTKEPGKGTGLGLAIVYGVLEQSGGFIDVQTEPGKGADFQIFLPRVDAASAADAAAAEPIVAPRGNETILLVEDEISVRNMARLSLEAHGYLVLEAAGGPEAVRLCQQTPAIIHLVLTDVVMPHMSGRQLTEQLAVLRPAMKILYMSGYTGDAVVRHGIERARTAFLQKPFTPTKLARKVREVLDAPR
jgi:two-component system, cell cycle sensor histidine kinase and response regulator CckA